MSSLPQRALVWERDLKTNNHKAILEVLTNRVQEYKGGSLTVPRVGAVSSWEELKNS